MSLSCACVWKKLVKRGVVIRDLFVSESYNKRGTRREKGRIALMFFLMMMMMIFLLFL